MIADGLETAESGADWLKSNGLKCAVMLDCETWLDLLMDLGLRGIRLIPDSCGDEMAGY